MDQLYFALISWESVLCPEIPTWSCSLDPARLINLISLAIFRARREKISHGIGWTDVLRAKVKISYLRRLRIEKIAGASGAGWGRHRALIFRGTHPPGPASSTPIEAS